MLMFFDLHAKVCDCGFFYQLVVINSWSHYDTTRVTWASPGATGDINTCLPILGNCYHQIFIGIGQF